MGIALVLYVGSRTVNRLVAQQREPSAAAFWLVIVLVFATSTVYGGLRSPGVNEPVEVAFVSSEVADGTYMHLGSNGGLVYFGYYDRNGDGVFAVPSSDV